LSPGISGRSGGEQNMPYKLTFCNERANGEIAYIGGKSLLPEDIDWPKNHNGENLVLIITLSTDFLNKYSGKHYSPGKIVSVFTTYNKKDYFLDSIVYNGDDGELENIKAGFTKVILHDSAGGSRNESEFEIPERCFQLIPLENNEIHNGSKLGGEPFLLQHKNLKLDDCEYVLQIYGNDFPEEYNDIFCLNDSMGYLYMKNGAGMFFTQCS
jgi:uncharacterized protein YwqG